jgi:hypothetical protein
MNREQRIHDEVEKTIQAFDTMPRLLPNPFFSTKVQARWSAEGKQQRRLIPTIRIKSLALTLIVILNLVTALYFFHTKKNISTKEQLVTSLSGDYTTPQADFFGE